MDLHLFIVPNCTGIDPYKFIHSLITPAGRREIDIELDGRYFGAMPGVVFLDGSRNACRQFTSLRPLVIDLYSMTKNYHLDLLIGLALSAGTVLLANFDVPAVPFFVNILSLIVFPGWFLCNIIFHDITKLHLIMQVILTYILGSIIIALELWMLIWLRFPITKNWIIISGLSISLIMELILLIVRRTRSRKDPGAHELKDMVSLGISSGLLFAASFFIWLSRPVSQERYTEFYLNNENTLSSPYTGTVIIINHEGLTQNYQITCTDNASPMLPLARLDLSDGSMSRVEFSALASNPDQPAKLLLALYHQQDPSPYRQIEIMGDSCSTVSILGLSVR